jgi:methionine-rich copper-binding protein CopC
MGMDSLRTFHRRAAMATLVGLMCLLLPHAALAHAVLVRSTPAAHAAVKPGDLPITLTYNSRIDVSRSAVVLVGPDGKRQPLAVEKQAGPNVLSTRAAGLKPGSYTVEWQVLSTDGHITRGTIEFRVE